MMRWMKRPDSNKRVSESPLLYRPRDRKAVERRPPSTLESSCSTKNQDDESTTMADIISMAPTEVTSRVHHSAHGAMSQPCKHRV
jgi:hypothetical protein